MPYLIPDARIAVFFSPKGGGTSLRAYLFHLENGFPFRDYRVQGKTVDANALLRNTRWRAFDQSTVSGFDTFAVVRDPVRRFLSGFSNRVLHYRELSAEKAGETLKDIGLPPNPDITAFIDNFDGYKQASRNFRRHFWPQQAFLGDDPGFYTGIYTLENIGALVKDLNGRFGVEAEMPRLQTGGAKLSFDDLDRDTRRKLLELVDGDIAFDMNPDYRTRYTL